jgi:hypothetical protein
MKNNCLTLHLNTGCKKTIEVPSNTKLRLLVDLYKKHCRPVMEEKLAAFKDLPFKKALALAEQGKEALRHAQSDQERHMDHVRRAKKESIKIAETKLGEKSACLKRCRTFDRLFREIDRIVLPITGLKDMYAYDVALRIGASKGIYPERVYLQQGAREGAKKLGLDFQNRTIEWSSLPSEMHCLNAYECEDFLCIFKHLLESRTNSNK